MPSNSGAGSWNPPSLFYMEKPDGTLVAVSDSGGQKAVLLEIFTQHRANFTIVVDHDEIGKVPFSAKGRWEDESTLVLTVLSAWAIPETWTLSFREDDSATLRIKTSFLRTELELN